ncbi:hypothetical protein PIB30_065693, partial [Stylosanthes scabra]|nr:hypothetical protein [Stylosanthes scabra]
RRKEKRKKTMAPAHPQQIMDATSPRCAEVAPFLLAVATPCSQSFWLLYCRRQHCLDACSGAIGACARKLVVTI